MHRLLNDFPNTLRLLSLHNRYRGEQAVVLCPGSSLDRVDLSLLEGHEHLQGTNGFYAKWKAPFRHFFCSSILFYGANLATVPQLPCENWFLATYLKSNPTTGNWKWPDEKRTHWMTINIPPLEARNHLDPLQSNVLRVLPWGPTVLFDLMLPTLIWMGYSEILLLGADYSTGSYVYAQSAAQNGNGHRDAGTLAAPPKQPEGIDAAERRNEMQLAHGRSLQWRDWLQEHQPTTRVLNCSPGSQLPGFECADLEDYV